MGETIFMIHGMWCGGWCWENFVEYFQRNGYSCIAHYLRHHTVQPSDKPPKELGGTSLLDYAADLEGEINRLEEKPVIMGHSMGGLLAQILAARGLAKAAVLITPASPSGIGALKWSVVRCFIGSILKLKFLGFPHRPSFRASVYAMMHLLPPEEQSRIYSRLVYESGRAAREIGFWRIDWRRASRVDESAVTCPMLVVSGAEDRITPASVVKQVACKYMHVSTYETFENHAHFVLAEPGWEEIARFISNWLDDALKTPASLGRGQ